MTGYVAVLLPCLSETVVSIVPLHAGRGMRVKILDAWSWGLPIVSTTIRAEGIDVENGKGLLLADTALAFAQAVVQILRELVLAQELGQSGRQTVLEKYDWRVICSAWDEVYSELNRDKGSPTLGPVGHTRSKELKPEDRGWKLAN